MQSKCFTQSCERDRLYFIIFDGDYNFKITIGVGTALFSVAVQDSKAGGGSAFESVTAAS